MTTTPSEQAKLLFLQSQELISRYEYSEQGFSLLIDAFACDPANPEVNEGLVRLYADKRILPFHKMEQHLLFALECATDRAFVYSNLADLYRQASDLDQAKSAALKGLEDNPQSLENQRILSELYMQLKEYQVALDSLNREERIAKLTGNENYSRLPAKTDALIGLGRITEACTLVRTFISETSQKDGTNYYLLASLLFKADADTRASDEPYELIKEGLQSAYEPTRDPLVLTLYGTAATICALNNDHLNEARFYVRLALNTVLHFDNQIEDSLRQIGNKEGLLQVFKDEFSFSEGIVDSETYSRVRRLISDIEHLNS